MLMRSVLVAAALLAFASSPAAAAPTDRAGAIALWESIKADADVPAEWTGSTEGCVVGDESAASRAATLRTINALRDLAGLAPVTLDPERNRQALAAALMMRAAQRLSHYPEPDWPCYSEEGVAGAATSNLFLGISGAYAMVGYVDDAGVPSLGHRRWLLDPSASQFGTGSTGTTNALSVVGGNLPVAPGTVVAWPPAGWVPWPLVFHDWSVELHTSSFEQEVDAEAAQVSVRVDGAPVSVTGVTALGSMVKWQVGLDDSARSGDHRIDVEVTGVLFDGQPFPVSYSLVAVAVPSANPRGRSPRPVRILGKPRLRRTRGGRLAVRVRTSNALRVRVRWTRDGRSIQGARGRTYRIKRRDRGHRVRAVVIAVGARGSRTTRASNALRIGR